MTPGFTELLEYAKAVEKWEAELILCDEAWDGGLRAFPQFTGELYDKWMELQAMRNKAIKAAKGNT